MSVVEFHPTMRTDRKFFSLMIVTEDPLQDEEFAACLVDFAQDIFDGKFKFDDVVEEQSMS